MPADDPKERLVEVDANDKEIGSIERAIAHSNPKRIHRAVFVLVTNKQQEMLFQLRSASKDLYPLSWALSCAGHVNENSTYKKAAVRELDEELHLKAYLYLVTKALMRTERETEYCQIYVCRTDTTPTEFDKDEVKEVKWVKIDAIQEFVLNNPLPAMDMEVLKLLMYIS